jgi:uncharacterized protein (TIGR02147 family)
VFGYDDFRAFLSDYYRYMKAADPKVSHRYIARRVGAASTGWFANLISGRINLTGMYLIRLAKLMKLAPWESDFMGLLVNWAQAASGDEREVYDQKIRAFRASASTAVTREEHAFNCEWYIAAVLDLLQVHDFQTDYENLACRLTPSITPQQAAYAVKVLKALGLIAADAAGHYRPCGEGLARPLSGFGTSPGWFQHAGRSEESNDQADEDRATHADSGPAD